MSFSRAGKPSAATPAPHTPPSQQDQDLAKLELKYHYLLLEENHYRKRLALHKGLFYDAILFRDVCDTLDKAHAMTTAAEQLDLPLARRIATVTHSINKINYQLLRDGIDYVIQNGLANTNAAFIAIYRYSICTATFHDTNLFPTTTNHLAANLTHLENAVQQWNRFHSHYTSYAKQTNYIEKYHTDLKNHVATIKARYHLHFALHFANLMQNKAWIKPELLPRIKKSLRLATRFATLQNNQLLLERARQAKSIIDHYDPASCQNASLTSSTLRSTAGMLQQLTIQSRINRNDVEQQAHLEFYHFTETKLRIDSPSYQPKRIVNIDIDDTLCKSLQNPINLIKRDELLHFLGTLDSDTKVCALTSRYYPELDTVYVDAIEVIELIHSLLNKPVFSSIIYTSANSKYYAMDAQFKQFFYHDLNQKKSCISLSDDIQKPNLDEVIRQQYTGFLADATGNHLTKLHRFVGTPDLAMTKAGQAQHHSTPIPKGP